MKFSYSSLLKWSGGASNLGQDDNYHKSQKYVWCRRRKRTRNMSNVSEFRRLSYVLPVASQAYRCSYRFDDYWCRLNNHQRGKHCSYFAILIFHLYKRVSLVLIDVHLHVGRAAFASKMDSQTMTTATWVPR